jgi:hypothetical protein
LFAPPPYTYAFANELKGGEQIIIHACITSNFSGSNGPPRITFLYNAKNDETRNLLRQNKETDALGSYLS